MTTPRFDELIHPSTRLSLVATLAAADWADFGYLKDVLALSDSALSKQLAVLEQAGYVVTERRLDGSRHKVRAQLSAAGRTAFDGHVAALQLIVSGGAQPSGGTGTAACTSGSPAAAFIRSNNST